MPPSLPHGSGSTRSFWMDDVSPRPRRALAARTEADVCVIGGGLAGVTTAYLMSQMGRKVVLVDDGSVGSGETSRTTAHLTDAMDDRIYMLERWHGERKAHQIVQSHAAAINKVQEIVEVERIECGFARVPGYLFLGSDETPTELGKEQRAATRAGLDVRRVPQAPIRDFDTGPAIRFDHQGLFHPLRYLHALCDRIEKRGGRIHEGVHISSVEEGRPVRLATSDGKQILARDVVVATNPPITSFFGIHTKQTAWRTFVIAAPVPRNYVRPGLYWDTGWPYHYIRTAARDGKTYLIVGGEDRRTGFGLGGSELDTLEAWALERFPKMGPVEYRWSGQVMEPLDGAAFIGPDPEIGDHVWVITGDSGQGMTHTTLGAMLVADLIQGEKNPWAEVYDPSRKMIKQAAHYLKGTTMRNLQFVRRAVPARSGELAKIPVGQGRIIKRGFRQLAVYRETEQRFCAFNAACTHLGCPVRWNDLEHSFDCTCHGSRFAPDGAVISGPANEGLKPYEGTIDDVPVERRTRRPASPKTARRRAGLPKTHNGERRRKSLLE